ncbi:TPA: aminoglycoside 3'-phosphotransferase [Streptococcus equi subsp. zooepidemicus]|uniref:aminoglycoside 3'-phosphotransferase n=1 Tax=Streptococcus equi TaxID=1336 RepID=UPI0010C41CB9|nr:aminoglycoside 3'-phosphotransferase [Streptococcus equi subsp. zooepidemicus]HEL0553261.1 aminoglycoside 3'-phosphotransferase [Streptococcus equi subsp. zooepidemicus]HEL0570121.1 aminoglycoside 3'-phosphotransferase [Streptococcus equi subsp. zooepidemicus]HEL0601059.1 aminoglycoside 3'-phosphotransferase [Streptococcus equi subsp. zooepidemicus]HEL0634530.1 aminoglycoside 3'-phosphotransferase [Streptococcus equi subsp. zooepidemicus]
MKQRLIVGEELSLPPVLKKLLQNSLVYDSSSSAEARVYAIDKGQGYFLKTAAKGRLAKEAALTRYCHSKGLATEVLDYISGDQDWLLTAKVAGEDASHIEYLSDPKRLCRILVDHMLKLHSLSLSDFPVADKTLAYIEAAEAGYHQGRFNQCFLPPQQRFQSQEEAYRRIQELKLLLQHEILIHGDFCLPNMILDRWQFQSMIDWGEAGKSDRHIDLFWLIWSLQFNLKTDRYKDYVLDCYGRRHIDLDILDGIAAFEVFA